MGVQGLWSLVLDNAPHRKNARLKWQILRAKHLRDSSDVVVLDASAFLYGAMETLTPSELRLHASAGNFTLIRERMETWFRMLCVTAGYKLVLVRDGAPRPEHEEDYMRRRAESGRVQNRYEECVADNRFTDAEPAKIPGVLLDAVMAQAVRTVRREGAAIEVLTAKLDADRVIAAYHREHKGRIAAIVTGDSDMLAYGIERVVRLSALRTVFMGELNHEVPLYGFSDIAPAVLERVDLPTTSEKALELAHRLLPDIFVILGHDGSKLVRNACVNQDRSVWFLIHHIFEGYAHQKGWVKHGRVTKKLFLDNKLKSVAARWDEFESARLEHNDVPPMLSLLHPAHNDGAIGIDREWSGWPATNPAMSWRYTGLGVFMDTYSTREVFEALQPLRAETARRIGTVADDSCLGELGFRGTGRVTFDLCENEDEVPDSWETLSEEAEDKTLVDILTASSLWKPEQTGAILARAGGPTLHAVCDIVLAALCERLDREPQERDRLSVLGHLHVALAACSGVCQTPERMIEPIFDIW